MVALIRVFPALICWGLLSVPALAGDIGGPRVFNWDSETLGDNARELRRGSDRLQPALDALIAQAEKALLVEPVSVMLKKQTPPSGDKHDYMSQAPYAWPNPNREDGLPYVRRDGERCPDADSIADKGHKSTMVRNVETLALAFFFTRDERYAEHCARLLRTWFLDPATRMNPNLNYTQRWPGLFEGRRYGILDCWQFVTVVDCVGLLTGSKSWTKDDYLAMDAWFTEYLDWLLESKLGKPLAKSGNNHGSWYDVQVITYALFLGEDELAAEFAEAAKQRRVEHFIRPDGSQPAELARTKSWDYSIYNLQALFKVAFLAQHAGVDLWNYESEDGRSLRGALDFLAPYGRDHSDWEYQQIKDWSNGGLIGLLYMAAVAYGEPEYRELADELSGGWSETHRRNLLMPAP